MRMLGRILIGTIMVGATLALTGMMYEVGKQTYRKMADTESRIRHDVQEVIVVEGGQ